MPSMVRYRRNFIPGGTWFFTVTLADRRSDALVGHVAALRSAFRAARRTAICDRRHCGSSRSSARHSHPAIKRCRFLGRWRRIKGHFSSAPIGEGLELKRWPNGDLALWQRRFWEHTIRDDRDFARHIDYIHFNPVKHGLDRHVRDWPFSSFHRYVREGILPEEWAGDANENGSDFGEPANVSNP
jgi:putative transposase